MNRFSSALLVVAAPLLTQCSDSFLGSKSEDSPDVVDPATITQGPAAATPRLTGNESSEVNGIAAKVNGKVITKKELAFHMGPTVRMLQAKHARPNAAFRKEFQEAQDGALEELVEEKLVLSQVERNKAEVPEHVLDREVDRIIREVYDGNEKAFRAEFKKTGMTMRSFRESQREKILVQAFRSQQFKDIAPPTPQEVREHYNKRRGELRDRSQDTIKFQKIFVRAEDPTRPGSTPEQQLQFAESLARQLRDGADFAEVARAHSADAFADQGGIWPETSRLDLSTEFAQLLFDAPLNVITGPLKDPYGFTIVRVLEKDYGPAPSFGEVNERMYREVEIEKRADRYKTWVKLLKRNAMIERRM